VKSIVEAKGQRKQELLALVERTFTKLEDSAYETTGSKMDFFRDKERETFQYDVLTPDLGVIKAFNDKVSAWTHVVVPDGMDTGKLQGQNHTGEAIYPVET